MENVTLEVKTRQVGNSLALFIPADVRDEMQIGPNEEIILHLHKKKIKNKLDIASLRGSLKGKNIVWKCEEDRRDRT